MRFFSAVILVVAALRLEGAMVKVVEIVNGQTIAIARNGVRETVILAGVEVIDDARARELLRWTAGDAWVMLEHTGKGEYLVYRSPDALFLNRELVLRGFAHATLPATAPELRAPSRYLGQIQPALSERSESNGPKAKPKVNAKTPRQKSSGSGPRSPKSRTRRARSPSAR